MTPQKLKKALADLDNVTDVASSPGNYNVDKYMLGMANGLILAQAIFKGGEPAYLTAPDKWLSEKPLTGEPTDTAKAADPIEAAHSNAAMEDMLVGLWMSQQTEDGKTTVDLTIVEHIRTGIRLAL